MLCIRIDVDIPSKAQLSVGVAVDDGSGRFIPNSLYTRYSTRYREKSKG